MGSCQLRRAHDGIDRTSLLEEHQRRQRLQPELDGETLQLRIADIHLGERQVIVGWADEGLELSGDGWTLRQFIGIKVDGNGLTHRCIDEFVTEIVGGNLDDHVRFSTVTIRLIWAWRWPISRATAKSWLAGDPSGAIRGSVAAFEAIQIAHDLE